MMHGFAQDIQIDVISDQSEDDNLSLDEIRDLIKEFKSIMEIPEEERTVEEWNRAIDIIFKVYYGGDVKALIDDLKTEKEKYSTLIKEIEEKIYFLLDNFSKPSDNDKKNTIFFDVGYNSDQQLDLGINYNRTINNIVIGGGFHVETNFKDDTNFIFNFNFGWRF